jgi:hypothetical protein
MSAGVRFGLHRGHGATTLNLSASNPNEIVYFSWLNPSNRTVVLGSTQPLREMSTGNLPGGKGRPARKADSLTAICEPIV